jgi:sulfite exporter TauE/SafE
MMALHQATALLDASPHYLDYGAALMTGLLGSAHCLGMCGGLVSAFFTRLNARGFTPHAAYHSARLGVYMLIGLTAALLGTVLVSTGLTGLAQGLLQIVAGIVVILLGLEMLGQLPWRNTFSFAPIHWLRQQFAAAFQRGPVAGALIGGAINALMPCSMTLAMATKASTASSPGAGALLLLCFGLGTLPAMLSASFLFARLGCKTRSWLLKAAGMTVILLGLSTCWQGLRYYLVMQRLLF